ncbi:hypothetical protein ACFOGJ_16055 [Marinibaculum pumilum]|uniref:Uncharacterized protein n=1 Tax=Marinibaculum pumilum TaxID=1766165 RepID=A0ABV7L270_9PROT
MTCKPLSEATGKVMSDLCRAKAEKALRPIQDAIAAGDPDAALAALFTEELRLCLGQWRETQVQAGLREPGE